MRLWLKTIGFDRLPNGADRKYQIVDESGMLHSGLYINEPIGFDRNAAGEGLEIMQSIF